MPTWPASATNEDLVLCVVGILQPASSAAVYCFLRGVFDGEESATVAADVRAAIRGHVKAGRLMNVQDSPGPLYSVTFKGNDSLPGCWSKLRDRARMFLLRGRPGCKIASPREDIPAGLTGASPVSLISASIQRRSTLRDGDLGHISEEGLAGIRPGLLGSSRGSSLSLLSFDSLEQLARAGLPGDDPMLLNPAGISLALGVSAPLLDWLASQTNKNYRIFTIKTKKSNKKSYYSPAVSFVSEMSRICSAPFRTRHAGGINSGTSHLLPQRWHVSMSGRLSLPQLAQVTSVIFGRVSL